MRVLSCGRDGLRKVTLGLATATRRWSVGFVIAVSTLTAQAAGPQIQTMTLQMQSQLNYFTERCFTLEVGQRLTYQFTTRHPVEFNLHHHLADGGTEFPDRLTVKSQHSNQHVAISAGGYCFQAANRVNQPDAFDIVITYEITAH